VDKIPVVSLYTGAGGLDYGFEAAGFETRVAIDLDPDCCETIRMNRSWHVIQGDIVDVSSQTILGSAGLKPGEVPVLIGGPPCQPFSKSAYWRGDTGRLRDPRANTLREFMRCVNDMLPEVFLLENVHGLRYSGKEEGFIYILRLTEEINRSRGTNYRIAWAVLNAADYGVPQIRQRLFLVGHREGKVFQFPAPTHAQGADVGDQSLSEEGSRLPYMTAWDAIGDLGDPDEDGLEVTGRWADLLPTIPEGENYLWHTDRKGGLPLFGWRTRYWSFLLKLAKSRPSWTIQAEPGPAIGPFHWKNRRLSTQEMARLQTFPDGLKFAGNRRSRQRQLGNAVPSLLAEILARAIGEQFFGRTYKQPPKLAVQPKRPIPPPEPTTPVPEKYLSLVGNHAPHPGTGKGARARRLASQSIVGDVSQ